MPAPHSHDGSIFAGCSLQSGGAMSPGLLFFLGMLWLFGVFQFHTKYRIAFQFLLKCCWNFDRDCIISINVLGGMHFLTIFNSSTPQTQDIVPFTCDPNHFFFIKILQFLVYRFSPPWLNLFLSNLLF